MYFKFYLSLFQSKFTYFLILFTIFQATKLLQFQKCKNSSLYLRSLLILLISFFLVFPLHLVYDLSASSLYQYKDHRIYQYSVYQSYQTQYIGQSNFLCRQLSNQRLFNIDHILGVLQLKLESFIFFQNSQKQGKRDQHFH